MPEVHAVIFFFENGLMKKAVDQVESHSEPDPSPIRTEI